MTIHIMKKTRQRRSKFAAPRRVVAVSRIYFEMLTIHMMKKMRQPRSIEAIPAYRKPMIALPHLQSRVVMCACVCAQVHQHKKKLCNSRVSVPAALQPTTQTFTYKHTKPLSLRPSAFLPPSISFFSQETLPHASARAHTHTQHT